MEPPSAPSQRGHRPWQGLLLAASLLTFWSPPTTAQLAVVSPNVTEGEDVLFLVHNLPEDGVGYGWFRAGKADSAYQIASYIINTQTNIPGPAHSGRETIYSNGSLLIKNVTQADTGDYTLQVTNPQFQTKDATGHLLVYSELPKPNITSNNSNPVEHKDPVELTCEPEIQDANYLWLINGQSIQNSSKLELSKDNRTLMLLRVTRTDIGRYECELWNPVSASRSDPLYLNVSYGPDTPTISPSHTHYQPGVSLRLSCHADSNPSAQYSWFINGTLKQSTQELLITDITVNDTGSYTCRVHNSVTGLNNTAVIDIIVSDNDSTQSSPGLSDGAIAGIVIGVLAAVALITALVYFLYIRKTGGVRNQHDLTEHKPSASNHSQGHSDISPNKVDEVAYCSVNFSVPESGKQTSASPSPRTTETVYSELKKK